MVLIPHIEGFIPLPASSRIVMRRLGSHVELERPTRAVELGVGHSGTRKSSRTEIPSSGELALTNKERMVGLVGQFRLAPPYYSCPTSRRSNESKNFS